MIRKFHKFRKFHKYCKQCGLELRPKIMIGNIIVAMYCSNAECHLYGIHQEGVNTPMEIIQDPDVPKIKDLHL